MNRIADFAYKYNNYLTRKHKIKLYNSLPWVKIFNADQIYYRLVFDEYVLKLIETYKYVGKLEHVVDNFGAVDYTQAFLNCDTKEVSLFEENPPYFVDAETFNPEIFK